MRSDKFMLELKSENETASWSFGFNVLFLFQIIYRMTAENLETHF